jgi:hypothetical protein
MLAVEDRLRYYYAFSTTSSYQAVSVNTDLHVFQCGGGFSNLILCSFKLFVGQKPVFFFLCTDRHEPSSLFSQFCECT